MKRLTNTVHSFLRAGVPRRTAVAAASTVGAMGSFTTLALAYRAPLNRCRCSRADRRAGPFSWHCERCLKRTGKGVLVSFLTSPLYVAGAAVGLVHCAHVAGTPLLQAARGARQRARGFRV